MTEGREATACEHVWIDHEVSRSCEKCGAWAGREATLPVIVYKRPFPDEDVMLCARCRGRVVSIDAHLLVGCVSSPARETTEKSSYGASTEEQSW